MKSIAEEKGKYKHLTTAHSGSAACFTMQNNEEDAFVS